MSAWPTALGLILVVPGIALAFGSLVCVVVAGWGLLAPGEESNGADFMMKAAMWMSALLLALGIWQVKGGWMPFARIERSRLVLTCWAIVMVPIGILPAHMLRLVLTSPHLTANVPGWWTITVALGLIVALAWTWGLPAFMLLWFHRSKVQDEIATWDDQVA